MNVKKLKLKMLESDKNIDEVADYVGCNVSTLYRKMSGVSDFTVAEIQGISTFLKLTQSDVNTIFFDEKLA